MDRSIWATLNENESLQLIWEDLTHALWRGVRDEGGHLEPILAVVPCGDQPRRDAVDRLAHEFALKGYIDKEWAARPIQLLQERGSTILLLEDPGGEPLARLVGSPIDIGTTLRLALALVTAIGRLHREGIIHKDIKPSNILVATETNEVWLTGFGIASRAPRERQSPLPPEVIVGTLAYIAPEQTGRMNRSIDFRSDLYSLGVTLYEMLTGVLPFVASDPMELIHCHIARQPAPPRERVASVPEAVSAIVLKLLSKAAEDRYQTAEGLHFDLQRCLTEWEASRRIELFKLAAHDASSQLRFREKLYGRETEITRLTSAFDRLVTQGTSELVLVSGYSGTGKSSVVNELQRALVPSGGLFAVGKFDQYKRGIPYATLAQAFQGLVRQLLCKSDAELARWRDALTDALGQNGQLMITLVPELALIIGEQPIVPDLSGPEAQGRFLIVFRRLLGVFARREHPLVLFLDDLQWLDLATLDLFADIATQPAIQHLLLVGAYRDNEVGSAHPLTRRLDMIRKAGRPMQEIVLGGILPTDVARMLAEALDAEPKEVEPLARAIAEKTGGNPFFTIQFAGALADEKLLTYNAPTSVWCWDIDRISAKHVSDNVVDLMIERISRLPDASQQALKLAACMGNSFKIANFHHVLERTQQETQNLLREAIRTGLLLQVDATYAFAHDRVQEAAYAMLPESERAKVHRRIATRLFVSMNESEIEAQIFEIVNQFNRGEIPSTDPTATSLSASLNLLASSRAKASAAYPAAVGYLAQGAAQLGEEGWTSNYALAFALALEHAQCIFLCGEFNDVGTMIGALLDRAATDVDMAAAYRLKIELHVVRSENPDAIASGLAGLRLFGINISSHPSREDVLREYESIWRNLNGRPIECVEGLPAMTDPRMQAVMKLLAEQIAPAYFTDFNLMALLICRMVNVSLIHGATSASNQGYAWLGWLLGPAFARYQDGYRIGKFACDVISKQSVLLDLARVNHTMGLISSWTQPLAASVDWFRTAYRIGIEAGDLYFGCYSSAHIAVTLLLRGHDLEADAEECREYFEFAHSIGFRDGADLIVTTERTIASLRGLTRGLASFNDDSFDEAAFEAELTATRMNIVVYWYWTRKIMLHYLSGDHRAALVASEKAQPERWIKIVQIQHLDYHYYTALALAAQIGKAPVERGDALWERLARHHEQLRTWAEETRSPTFADKLVLVSAEIARLEGRELEAEHLYEDSIRLARENGFLQNEAIANETASRFYTARGFAKIARAYLRDARYLYRRWGAEAKARQLDEILRPYADESERAPGSTDTSLASVDQLDLTTVIRVSQAISSEIVLEKLIDTLMRTAIEHAGAQRAVLLLTVGAEHRIEADATTHGEIVTVSQRKGAVVATEFPESLVLYVARTRESAILDDASADSRFSDDPYVHRHNARSLVCLPLTNQGKLVGLLYLENNLAPGVFTPGRLAVLKLLASQAAISLENTRLYRDLEEREAKIRRLVDSNIIGIVIWDLDGRFIDANDAFLHMLHYEREDLNAGLRWLDMTPPEWQERIPHEIEELATTGVMRPCEKEYFRKDGSRVRVLIGAAAFDGQPNQGVAYILDLTERERAEKQARESERRYREVQSELAHANRVATIGHISAWIAHDVKQPLVGVVASGGAGLRWLETNPPNIVAARRAFERVVRDGHRAAGVLDRTRALIKKSPPQKEAVRVDELILETVALTEAEAKRSGIALNVSLENFLSNVLIDRIQLQQVILNLIINAIEALRISGAQNPELAISAGDEGDRVTVTVRDNGCGIAPELADKIFDAFYTTKPEGTGMGLVISRSIVESYGGRLWVLPNFPQGSTFRFSLPASQNISA